MEVHTKVRVSQGPVLEKTQNQSQIETKVQYYIHTLLEKNVIDQVFLEKNKWRTNLNIIQI